ncbi:MAG TPA: hypothetical protein VM686_22665 [Polyangiaceae bacterium]|nr:hypothetical protein [Polyangiaceae bacterium]
MNKYRHVLSVVAIAFVGGVAGCMATTNTAEDEDGQREDVQSDVSSLSEKDDCATVHAWVETNRNYLPSTYSERSFVSRSLIRRACSVRRRPR